MISVDPSSPFTQGALLGDRIRLADHFLDPGVFIRSMGTRGHLGGLAEATLQAALLLDAAGKELVFLETVGAGQSEVEVIGIADTVLLVLMPGSGDSVQALKAGIMEIPDVIAINKMDHPGREDDAERGALDPRARPRARVEAADRPDRGGARRERAASSGRRSRSTARYLESDGLLEERRRQEPRRRGVRGRVEPREGAPAGGRRRGPGAAARCSTRCRRASSTRCRPCVRSSRRCTGSAMTTTMTAPDAR